MTNFVALCRFPSGLQEYSLINYYWENHRNRIKSMKANKPTLVVLAAGMGSRYGGLKQLDTFTPQGHTIIDFSLYDAIDAGFGKIVFIIRKNIADEFRAMFSKKLEGKIEVDYVFQELDAVPEEFVEPERVKPWGTGHAMLMVKEVVKENFAIINADDFYGKEAFKAMADHLKETDSNSFDFSMMAYLLKNTVSDHGSVSRGECKVGQGSLLTEVTERTHIEKKGDQILVENESGTLEPIDPNTVVSMNFWGFTPAVFGYAEELFVTFLKENRGKLKSEFFIPLIVNGFLQEGTGSVKVLTSEARWFGVTYKEDKERVQAKIEALRNEGVYPENLW